MELDDAIEAAAAETGLDAALLRRIAEVESSGNPDAHETGSKYMGLFQLSQAEFLENGGGDIFDARDNAMAAARKMRKDADKWQAKHGAAATPFELYMIHQQGWAGFHALLAAPGQPAWRAIRDYYDSDERAQLAIRGNLPASAPPGELTAAAFLDFWRDRLGFDGPNPAEPSWLIAARRELGVKEAPGASDSTRVLSYYRDAGRPEVQHDEVAWCAAFVGAMLQRSGSKPTGSLMARSYLKWGAKLNAPRLGCVVVFWRESPDSASGHVGFYVGTAANGDILLLGGNQSDAVSIAVQPKSRVLGYRWPATIATVEPKVINMADRYKDILADFAPLAPILVRVMGGPAGAVAAAVLTDAIDKSGKRTDGESADQTLKRLGLMDVLPILKVAETALQVLGVQSSPPVVETPPILPVTVPVSEGATAPGVNQPVPPELSALDKIVGFTGYKTYIVILAGAVVNLAAGFGVLPQLLTPDTVATINTTLGLLGGATLMSKVERYVKLFTGMVRR